LSDAKFTWTEAAEAAPWDEVVAASPQGTLFSEMVYLDAVGRRCDRRYVMKGQKIRAAVCLVPTADGTGCELDDLVIYGGVMFPPDPERSSVKRRHEEFQLTEFVIEQLDRQYGSIEIGLAPQFQDLRPFLWHRYHDTDARVKYSLDLRYTSYVDLSGLLAADDPEQTACFASMETVRRYSVREARKKGGSVRQGSDGARFIEFYKSLMAQQGEPQSDHKLERIAYLIGSLLRAGRAAVYEVLDRNGAVLYVTIYAWDAKRAYYLFGAGHPEANEPWQGTIAHWEAFKDAARRLRLTEVDLEGVNSPRRGWFKLGFGGDLRPYYHVRRGFGS
jgi:hypothetical protein